MLLLRTRLKEQRALITFWYLHRSSQNMDLKLQILKLHNPPDILFQNIVQLLAELDMVDRRTYFVPR
jgi:hypothetical protein